MSNYLHQGILPIFNLLVMHPSITNTYTFAVLSHVTAHAYKSTRQSTTSSAITGRNHGAVNPGLPPTVCAGIDSELLLYIDSGSKK